MTEQRRAFGFTRTECACGDCVANCRFLPGYLIPHDLQAIAEKFGYRDLEQFALENLAASPGATVLVNGQIYQIPTLVPQRRTDGACKFLDAQNRCTIHAVSPFGCAFFTCTQSRAESDERSYCGLQAVAHDWVVNGIYARLWQLLSTAGKVALGPLEARARMKSALAESSSNPDSSGNSSPACVTSSFDLP